MTTFSDDFQRANGFLGANWIPADAEPHIASNQVTSTGDTRAVVASTSTSGAHDASATFVYLVANDLQCGVIVKSNDARTQYYMGRVAISGTGWLGTITQGAAITIASGYRNITLTSPVTLRLTYNDGTLALYVNGVLACIGYESTYNANTRVGIHVRNASNGFTYFTTSTPDLTALTVSPNTAKTAGPPISLSLLGTGTSWTPGNPGSPVFTASGGSLSGQYISSPSSATVWFTPPETDGTVVITDSSTGQTANVYVSPSGFDGGGGGGLEPCPFDDDFIDTANATVLADNRGLPTLQSVIVPAAHGWSEVYLLEALADLWYSHFRPEMLPQPPEGTLDRIDQLWRILNGGYTVPLEGYTQPSAVPLVQQLEFFLALYYEPVSETYWTIDQVLASIKGLDNRSITQVYDLVDALTGGSNQDVLDWLNLYLGTTGPTLAQLGTMISDLATIAGYTLGDVLDAIAAIPGTDLTAITNKLNLIQPSESADLTTITNQLTTIDGNVDDLENSLAAIRTGSNYTFQDILDAIAAITPGGPGESGPALSLWPGQENVTLGTELPLTDGMTVPGPLNGLIFTITASAPRAQKFMFGTVASWARVGQVLFVTDRGDYERGQTYGIDRHIVIPTTMTEAASALILVNSNWEGTVTPWTRT